MFDHPIIVASMFYEGDDLVLEAGGIDTKKAVERLEKTRHLSQLHNVPFMIDIEIPSTDFAGEIIRTVAQNSENQFWISSFNKEMRQEACKIAVELGLTERMYYSTLNYMSDEEEFRMVADLGVKPIIQVFNPVDPFPGGYLSKADELMNMAEKAGIAVEDVILLSTVLDFGSIPFALEAVPLLKEKYSLPVCVPSIGLVYKWAKEYSKDERRFLISAAMANTLDAGAELLHIGTVKRSFIAFPVVSLIDRFQERKQQLSDLR